MTGDTMEARTVPFNYCTGWIRCSVAIAQNHYSLFLGCSLLVFMSSLLISIIPFLGAIAAICLLFLFTVGQMRLTEQVRRTQTATFDDFLKYVFDPALLQKFAPFLIILAGIAVVNIGAALLKLQIVAGLFSLIGNLAAICFSFAAFASIKNPTLSIKTSALTVLQGLWQNVLTWLCCGLLVIILAATSAALCILPFFFYFLPMALPLGYLTYASIFEGLDIDATIAEWSSKSKAVVTLDAPRDGV